ncbi:TPA: NGG1p interacting factor NIF3 [Candidatus Peregrinibacteria bacterium]|nr:NGG1p interacting factor NIF3 [Candidatus Peregrinibacteria bacterium]
MGRKNDPRTIKEIEDNLKEIKKEYQKMDKKKKIYFDLEKLTNPYSDSRVLHGKLNQVVKTMMVCIDGDMQELLLVNALRANGQKIDLLFVHHPEGRGLVDLTRVMPIQESVMAHLGISINVIEKLLEPRIQKINRSLHPINHYRAVDGARLLDIPMMCCHTAADNGAHQFMDNFVNKKRSKLKYLKDLAEAFLDIPEIKEAEKLGMGPMIFSGSPQSKLGKVAITGMTGGTSGAEDVYEVLSREGVSTVIEMHMGEAYREKAEKYHLNVIITGHMASDSLGVNLILDGLEQKGIKIIPAGGLIRVRR